jgi:hypothetical protein
MGSKAIMVAAVLLVVLAGAAYAGGGTTIATAPALALGQQQENTVNGIDFWRLRLSAGDRTTLRYGPQKSYAWVEVCVWKPDVTDATVGNTACETRQANVQDSSFTFDARVGGNWTVAVVPYPGCDSNGILNLRCGGNVSYYLTAYAKHVTHLTLRAPTVARRGSTFVASGKLSGAHGSVIVEQSWNGGRWATSRIAHANGSGSFRFALHPKRRGSLRVRVSYPDGPLYVGSSAITSTRVV